MITMQMLKKYADGRDAIDSGFLRGADADRVRQEVEAVEQFLAGVDDVRMRRMLEYRFVQRLTWRQTAGKMGGRHTADNCRVTVRNYLREIEK